MTFSVTGGMVGGNRTVTWNDGKLEGDSKVIAYLETEARLREIEERPTGPPCGPYTWTAKDTLADPLAALFLILESFGQQATADNLEITGEVPEVPPGDIAADGVQ